MAVRVLLADDHRIFAEGLASLLRAQSGIQVVGIAQRGEEAVELASALAPDVVLLDLSMPGLSAAEATREILARCAATRVLALAARGEEPMVQHALRAGASGRVLKESAAEDLARAIRNVCSGGFVPPVGGPRDAHCARWRRASGRRPEKAGLLSDRERQVLRLVSEGKSNAETASLLGLSPHTVVRHRQSVMGKLNRHSVAELTRYAIREGLVSLD